MISTGHREKQSKSASPLEPEGLDEDVDMQVHDDVEAANDLGKEAANDLDEEVGDEVEDGADEVADEAPNLSEESDDLDPDGDADNGKDRSTGTEDELSGTSARALIGGGNTLTLRMVAKSPAMSMAPRTPPSPLQRISSNGRETRALTLTMTPPTTSVSLVTRGPIASSVAVSDVRQPNQELASAIEGHRSSLTEFGGDWLDSTDGDVEDNPKRVALGVLAVVTSGDRINGHTSGRGGRIGEDGEGQGGEDRKTEGTHCE